MIRVARYPELDRQTLDQLDHFIEEEFGHIPIVRDTEWAKPDWTIIYYAEDKIATFYNIIEREILVDDNKINAAGINNVITPSLYRGKGYASKVLRESENLIFDELKLELGLLLCSDDLIPFYERLNWYCVDCTVHFDQQDGKKLWKANTLLLSRKEKLAPHNIDLNGLPW